MIKLLIGGSPCTYWSIAQKKNRETEPSGLGWKLFENYLIAKEKFKPDFFLYENNKSAAKAIKDEIKKCLNVWDGTLFMPDSGARYIEINSALVSAQNRQRFYVHNCGEVEQPADRGILLRDILESGVSWREKSYCLDSNYYKASNGTTPLHRQSGKRMIVAEPVRIGDIGSTAQAHRVYSCDGKSVTINAGGGGQGGKTGLYACPIFENVGDAETIQKALPKLVEKYGYIPEQFNAYNLAEIKDKSPTLSTGSMVTSSCATTCFVPTDKPIYVVKDGKINIKGKEYPIKLQDGFYIIRKLTVTECCRLQTLPDDYCRAISKTQAYKGLGNGWTAEVIIHILNGALKNIPRDEKIIVLSMYDGIGTGRYCLDKMGFTNVEYHAFEIDKYAMQIAKSNFPDIIEHGDAFQVRDDNFTL
jgi:DNA (cytosine-5)-methyltransferase 3A|nr:MAG TPA: Cytosine specific methyltransferase [Caudoviricetes sp.]